MLCEAPFFNLSAASQVNCGLLFMTGDPIDGLRLGRIERRSLKGNPNQTLSGQCKHGQLLPCEISHGVNQIMMRAVRRDANSSSGEVSSPRRCVTVAWKHTGLWFLIRILRSHITGGCLPYQEVNCVHQVENYSTIRQLE